MHSWIKAVSGAIVAQRGPGRSSSSVGFLLGEKLTEPPSFEVVLFLSPNPSVSFFLEIICMLTLIPIGLAKILNPNFEPPCSVPCIALCAHGVRAQAGRLKNRAFLPSFVLAVRFVQLVGQGVD